MSIQLLFSLWNGGLTELSKTSQISCIRKLFDVVTKAVLVRCDEDSRPYWDEILNLIESLIVRLMEKNPEGRRHLQFVIDREILCIVNKINNIQTREEKHHKYLEKRTNRKPQYNNEDTDKNHKHKHKHCDEDDEDDCD